MNESSRLSASVRALLGLILLTVVATASTSAISSGRASESLPGSAIVTALGTAGVLVAICGMMVAAYVVGSGKTRRVKTLLIGAATMLLVAFGLFLCLVPEHDNFYTGGGRGACPQAPASWYEKRGYDRQTACASHTSGAGDVNGAAGGGEPDAHLLAAVAGATLLILIVGGGLLAFVLRRRRAPTAVAGGDAVLHAVDESLDDLRREGDVRRAIVACYSRMERALERTGAPRQPHEAPLEFLARVLERVAREPGRALTDLFERAKFSAEPMGEPEKERAISALESLRARLA